jgi:hypothetical protein
LVTVGQLLNPALVFPCTSPSLHRPRAGELPMNIDQRSQHVA